MDIKGGVGVIVHYFIDFRLYKFVVTFMYVFSDLTRMSCPHGWVHNQASVACYDVIHDWRSHDYATQHCSNSSSHLLVSWTLNKPLLNNNCY